MCCAKAARATHLLAGVGLGLACASKYTAGIVLVPLVAAIAARYLQGEPGTRPVARSRGIALAGLSALACFLLANPYALLDYRSFHFELVHQSTLSAEAQGKLGRPQAAEGSATTCGRSPGASAGCQRWRRWAER